MFVKICNQLGDMTYDLVIKNGTVIDPAQGIHAKKDIAVAGGKIAAISKGCDPSGLIARNLGNEVAKLVKTTQVDIKAQVDKNRKKITPKK